MGVYIHRGCCRQQRHLRHCLFTCVVSRISGCVHSQFFSHFDCYDHYFRYVGHIVIFVLNCKMYSTSNKFNCIININSRFPLSGNKDVSQFIHNLTYKFKSFLSVQQFSGALLDFQHTQKHFPYSPKSTA